MWWVIRPGRTSGHRRRAAALLLGLALGLPLPAAARRVAPSQSEQALAALLRSGGVEQLAPLCAPLVATGDTRSLQRVQARLLALTPAPQPLPVVLAQAEVLLRCQAPQAALRMLERYGPAAGAERRQWLLLRWRAANAGCDHRLAAAALEDLAGGDPASLAALELPVASAADGKLHTRAALDLLAEHLQALGEPRAAAEVLLASPTPGAASARRIARAVALLPQLPLGDQVRLLEQALDLAAAAGAWGLVSELLDQQLALPPASATAAARARAAARRLRLSRRLDDAYGEWNLLRRAGRDQRRTADLERQLRSPRRASGPSSPTPPALQP